jgi:ribulose-5-phosphate 4-epimerase/fuculose-1-phosphate aldolase
MATASQTAGTTETLAAAKVDLAAVFRAAAAHGYSEGIDNHASLAVPGRDDLFLVNRYGPHWSEMRASDLLTVDRDGNVVDGDGECDASAFAIHRGVHAARPTARCVIHTHMPYATAVTLTRDGLDTRLSQNAMYFHGRVAQLPYGGIATAIAEGERIGAAVGPDVTIVMLENHGPLVVGASVADAWHKLYFLERACEAQVLARSIGAELVRAPAEVAARTAAQWADEASESADALFAAVRRQLDRENPGYER